MSFCFSNFNAKQNLLFQTNIEEKSWRLPVSLFNRTKWTNGLVNILFCSDSRSSPRKVLYKKGVLKNFTKFRRKHLCQSLFFSKVADLRPATLLQKILWHMYFPVNFARFLRIFFFTEHLQTTTSGHSWVVALRCCEIEYPNHTFGKSLIQAANSLVSRQIFV